MSCTAKQAREVSGLPQGTFSQWLQRGLARPSVPGKGHGGRSEWTSGAIIAIVLTQYLGEDIELTKAADIAHNMLEFISKYDAVRGNELYPISINLRTYEWGDPDLMIKSMGSDKLLTISLGIVINNALTKINEVCDK